MWFHPPEHPLDSSQLQSRRENSPHVFAVFRFEQANCPQVCVLLFQTQSSSPLQSSAQSCGRRSLEQVWFAQVWGWQRPEAFGCLFWNARPNGQQSQSSHASPSQQWQFLQQSSQSQPSSPWPCPFHLQQPGRQLQPSVLSQARSVLKSTQGRPGTWGCTIDLSRPLHKSSPLVSTATEATDEDHHR
eukprot:COSAG04_NODE_2737_length_3655_cov_3.399606_4_plen_186_part_01